MINYNGRRFRTAVNTENGEVSNETIFNYYQQNSEVWADYSGGSVLRGSIIGKVNEEGVIDMVYHHLSNTGELRAGKCHSVPEVMNDGKIRLHETWQWTSGDGSSGQSIIEEI